MDVAVRYLGHALPRLEAVAWAANLLQGWSRTVDPGLPERQALDCVMRWLEEPTDEYRRAAHEAAERASDKSAERLLGFAVFMSGGSISQADLPAVQPAQQVCGALASSAVLVAAYRTEDPKAALASACDVGEKVAELGVKALAGK
jgi:alpha-D-ribose 1-methylphosphonate 5-triphosphate synthase subunit PhnI